MPVDPQLRRLAAFTLDPAGGNPAWAWIGPELPEPAEMQRQSGCLRAGDDEHPKLGPLVKQAVVDHSP